MLFLQLQIFWMFNWLKDNILVAGFQSYKPMSQFVKSY